MIGKIIKKKNFKLKTKKEQVAYMCLILHLRCFLHPTLCDCFYNDITYSNVNMQLSYRGGTDSVCHAKGLDSYRNVPISNNYLISLWDDIKTLYTALGYSVHFQCIP